MFQLYRNVYGGEISRTWVEIRLQRACVYFTLKKQQTFQNLLVRTFQNHLYEHRLIT